MKKLVQFLLICFSFRGYCQNSIQNKFYAEFLAGPYLMIDHHDYKSVFLKGTHLGYNANSKFSFGIEYLVGQQEDVKGQTGTTHTANGQINYAFLGREKKFSPYLTLGGGFFEFKDFTKDVLGVSYFTGLGTHFPIHQNIYGLYEFRYVNLSPLKLEGKNEIGVLWGIGVRF